MNYDTPLNTVITMGIFLLVCGLSFFTFYFIFGLLYRRSRIIPVIHTKSGLLQGFSISYLRVRVYRLQFIHIPLYIIGYDKQAAQEIDNWHNLLSGKRKRK